MPDIHITIRVEGQPAKRLFVQHVWRIGPITGTINHYITDDNGKVSFNSLTSDADIRILAQNSVARMVNGGGFWPVYVDEKVHNKSVVNLDSIPEQLTHFKLLQMATDSYNRVHRHFKPFKDTDYPFGRLDDIQAMRDRKKGIQIVYPDNLGQPAPFVEPASLATGYPLLHLKNRSQAAHNTQYNSFDRLFGRSNIRAEIMPHELAHALHFTQLSDAKRLEVEVNYIKFILGSIVIDGDASHNVNRHTTPMVAYIEAFGMFSDRAFAFVDYWAKTHTGWDRDAGFDVNLQKEFIKAETKDPATVGSYWLSGERQIAKQEGNTITYLRPIYTKSNSEAAVYGAIFLDFANHKGYGMEKAVQAFYESQALNFGEYAEWIKRQWPENNASGEAHTIDQVMKSWCLDETS